MLFPSNTRRASTLSLLVLGLASCVAVACGRDKLQEPASAPNEQAPLAPEPAAATPGSFKADSATSSEREPQTLAEAEQLLEKARAELDRLALAEPAPPAAGAAGPAAPRDAARKPESKKRAEEAEAGSSADRAGSASSEKGEQNSCDTACKAFSSLERASSAVCRLEADAGLRCQRARQIREDAARRVASCGCVKQ